MYIHILFYFICFGQGYGYKYHSSVPESFCRAARDRGPEVVDEVQVGLLGERYIERERYTRSIYIYIYIHTHLFMWEEEVLQLLSSICV